MNNEILEDLNKLLIFDTSRFESKMMEFGGFAIENIPMNKDFNRKIDIKNKKYACIYVNSKDNLNFDLRNILNFYIYNSAIKDNLLCTNSNFPEINIEIETDSGIFGIYIANNNPKIFNIGFETSKGSGDSTLNINFWNFRDEENYTSLHNLLSYATSINKAVNDLNNVYNILEECDLILWKEI